MKINFYVEKKITMWARESHEVEIESQEALEAKLKEILANGENSDAIDNELDSFQEQDFLFDTISELIPADNNNDATIEIKIGTYKKFADFSNEPNWKNETE